MHIIQCWFINKEDAYSMTFVSVFFFNCLLPIANCQLPIAYYSCWFINKEDAYSMTFAGVFFTNCQLLIAYCQLLIANYSNCKEDAYSMTFALGLFYNPVNPKILQILHALLDKDSDKVRKNQRESAKSAGKRCWCRCAKTPTSAKKDTNIGAKKSPLKLIPMGFFML
ncbi:MAG: hypothetical protein ACOYMA_08785 [Bacteroidia bacterium]